MLVVGKTNDVAYTTIQEAITICNDYATIHILNGYYVENIIINKPLTLIGEDKNHTIIDGGFQRDVIDIISQNVTIKQITIQNSNTSPANIQNISGIAIQKDNTTIQHCIIQHNIAGITIISNNNTIKHCVFINNSYGIYAKQAKGNSIANSTFQYNQKYGIYIYSGSQENIIKNNKIINNTNGIRIRARNNTVTQNEFTQNQHGLYVCCDSDFNLIFHNDFYHNLIYNGKGNYHQNTWYSPSQKEGNYWSDYTGLDDNNDGIGDTPHLILSREINGSIEIIKDDYPLMEPFLQE